MEDNIFLKLFMMQEDRDSLYENILKRNKELDLNDLSEEIFDALQKKDQLSLRFLYTIESMLAIITHLYIIYNDAHDVTIIPVEEDEEFDLRLIGNMLIKEGLILDELETKDLLNLDTLTSDKWMKKRNNEQIN